MPPVPRQSREWREGDYERIPAAGQGHGGVADDHHHHDQGGDASGSEESEDLHHAVGEDIDLPEDVYGAVMFSVVHDSIELMSGKDHDELALWINRARVTFVVTSLIFNYVLQLSLLWWSYPAVVAPAIRNVQKVYQEYHAECFDIDGAFSEAKCQDWDPSRYRELCGMVISSPLFLYLILCLWWMTMLNEFRKTDRLLRKFHAMAQTGCWEHQIETDEEGMQRVKRLVIEVRWFLYLILIFPKHMISIGLLVLGTLWLVATESFDNLILNSLALGFVIEIDELIFEAMFPAVMSESLSAVKIWRRRGTDPMERQRVIWSQYRRSAIYWLVILIGVYVYLACLQGLPWLGVLPGYKNDLHCRAHLTELGLVCDNWAVWNGAECFPYGDSHADSLPPHPEVYGDAM